MRDTDDERPREREKNRQPEPLSLWLVISSHTRDLITLFLRLAHFAVHSGTLWSASSFLPPLFIPTSFPYLLPRSLRPRLEALRNGILSLKHQGQTRQCLLKSDASSQPPESRFLSSLFTLSSLPFGVCGAACCETQRSIRQSFPPLDRRPARTLSRAPDNQASPAFGEQWSLRAAIQPSTVDDIAAPTLRISAFLIAASNLLLTKIDPSQ